jgi:phosphonate transport system substrate-binding protein
MSFIRRSFAALALGCASVGAWAQGSPLTLGEGLFQPDRERNDASYRPLAQHPLRCR